jgi:hypothetical protein
MKFLVRFEDGVEEVVEAESLDEAKKLARAALREGDWEGDETTCWPKAEVYAEGEDGEWELVGETYITVHPKEPPCAEDEDGGEMDHDWCDEDLQAHGGGMVVEEVCRHCGTVRVRDTWSDGLRRESVSYRDADKATVSRFREEGREAADAAALAEEPPSSLGALAREAFRERMEERIAEAREDVRARVLDPDASEDDGPEDYDEAADYFAAIFERRPTAEDGDHLALWSEVCAAIRA